MKKIKLIKNLYFKLFRIRKVELKIARKYPEQKMRCPVHLSIGQESVPVGVCENLLKSDSVVSSHRSHAHYLSKGGNLKKMISEIYGKESGCALGRGGSMHLIDLKVNLFASVPIVGSTIPIGVGRAWANKLDKKKDIVVIFIGDGATEEGVFFESLDFAKLHNLRVLFVCEDNQYSVYSNKEKRQSKERNLSKISKSFGLKSIHLKDHDLLKVYNSSKKLINYIRKKSEPCLLKVDTFRELEHCGPFNDDHLLYRNNKDVRFWKKNCQVKKYKKILTKFKNLKIEKIEKEIQNEIDHAFKFAEDSKFPKKNLLKKFIYKKINL
jgi:TPP-dependent pyruvate/acetoin dehydrogenase alpha subunit